VSFYHRLAPWIDLGRHDKWGPLLDRAIEERDPYLVYLRTTRPYLDWLDDPRFAEPLRKVGLLD